MIMKSTISNIKYQLLPEYKQNSQLKDLFLEHKFFWNSFVLFIFLSLYIQYYIFNLRYGIAKINKEKKGKRMEEKRNQRKKNKGSK